VVREYRFDKGHNSYFHLARSLRDAPDANEAAADGQTTEAIQTAIEMLGNDSMETRLAGMERLAQLGPAAKSALGAIYQCVKGAENERLLAAAFAAVGKINVPRAYPADVVREVERLSHCVETGSARHTVGPSGGLELKARVGANGANFLVIGPAGAE
jgi:hypothetical protein